MGKRLDKNSIQLLMVAKSATVYTEAPGPNPDYRCYMVRLDLGNDRCHYLHNGSGVMIWHDLPSLHRAITRKRTDLPLYFDKI